MPALQPWTSVTAYTCADTDVPLFFLQQLAKAVAMFVGSVIVMRNFGDAFAI